ncbi:MAG: YkgJ family cysteine cluster protein [Tissierellia bacterium]|nr:YkgJ family cysteine cluster protein [Tissierellia bacterium]MDD4727115.1 YkgJ family cysteine cluster protein [Tissierellia bacterium]
MGRKKKKSHIKIHGDSLANTKLKIYKKLEDGLEKQSEISEGITLCVPGCTDCCHDYFTVQNVEFDLIMRELLKWDEEKLNNLIGKVEKYWKVIEGEYPKVLQLFTANENEIEKINSSIDKTSFPCIFLDENTRLCQIYDSRPFKCRIFGNTYYYSEELNGAAAIACNRYGRLLNEENFDLLLYDVTKLLDENTDLSLIHENKGKSVELSPEFPLIYHLYQYFIAK